MFYHRCSLIKQINTTISEQDATTDSLLTNAIGSSVIDLILWRTVYVLYTGCYWFVYTSCVLTTFNKHDDDDDDVDDGIRNTELPSEQQLSSR